MVRRHGIDPDPNVSEVLFEKRRSVGVQALLDAEI
jgi:hypothetical protein